jgi:superfamily I DNA/RNA helicase
MKIMIQGTEQQEAIWNEITHGNSHVMVNAGAGTGKTFTIVEAANRIEGKKAFLAFNKSIATELGERLPDDVYAATFHSMGNASIRKNLGYKKMNNWKTANIIGDVLGKDYFAMPLVKLVGFMKGALIDANDRKSILNIIDSRNIAFGSDKEEIDGINALPQIMKISKTHAQIDFDDMIWLPIVLDLPMVKYDVMFVDEAQDFNEAQRQLIYRCVEPDGRCIIVGDRNQAIYGFRGADSSSMDIFAELLTKTNREIKEFPLSLTWRCPTSVVAEANRFVEDFHCKDDAIEGKVVVDSSLNPSKGDMVLCRYNAPLVTAFYKLIGDGKSAYIKGKDLTKGLVNSVKKISKDMSLPTQEFAELLDADFEYRYKKLVDQEKFSQANNLEDKHECLCLFVYRAETVGGIIKEIEKVFNSDGKGDIMLSTVHKAKGLEANNVFLLATERMPHPKATNMKEEMNICYVAITRAKVNLHYCGPRPSNGGQ